jgi:hypothetical protein
MNLLNNLLAFSPLTLHQLQNTDVVIIGQPASGKSYLSELLKGEMQILFHTDDYIKHGYEQSIYVLLEDLKKNNDKPRLVEGVGGYRLLRKGLQTGTFFPRVIINVQITSVKSRQIYEQERSDKDYKKVEAMIKGNEKVYQEYLNTDSNFKPLIIDILNIW